MRAGKDVLCEKPLTMDAAEAREIQAVREETGKLTLEAFAYRFSPIVERAVEIVRSGRIGELRLMHSTVSFVLKPDPANVRLMAGFGGGAVYDVGCYAINVQRMLAGREPQTAYCQMEWSDQFDVDMAGTGVLDYGGGLKGTFSFGFKAPVTTFFAVGSEGSLVGPRGWGVPQGEVGLLLTAGGKTEPIITQVAMCPLCETGIV